MSVNAFSTSTALLIKPLNASETEFITPTAAPNARVRATEASRDFWNSARSPLILPNGCLNPFSSNDMLKGRIFFSAAVI